MKYFFLVSVCLVIISCTRNVEQVEQNAATHEGTVIAIAEQNTTADEEAVVTINESRIVAYRIAREGGVSRRQEIRYDDINFQDLPIGITGIALRDDRLGITFRDSGTFLLTNITGNNVAVKNYPSLGRVIHNLNNNDIVQVIGFSGERVSSNGFYGFWVKIIHQKTENESIQGWVFSKYININNEEYTPIRFVEFIPGGHSSSPANLFIRLAYTFEGNEVSFRTWTRYWNNYHIIVRGPFNNYFHYTNRPGVYILNTETFQLEHKTYLGTFMPFGGSVAFTENSSFLLQDFGTGPGIRGIRAWRMSDFEQVFSGGYHGVFPPIIGDNTIEVVNRHTDWDIEQGRLDEEMISYGKIFREENPVPQEMLDRMHPSHSVELIIRSSFNLDTGERTILGGEWILTQ